MLGAAAAIAVGFALPYSDIERSDTNKHSPNAV